MPRKIAWTEEQHETIRRMILAGQSALAVSQLLGVARWTIREYAREHQIAYHQVTETSAEVSWHHDPHREPLPPGHEITWGAIVAGTCLDGMGYPL